MSLTQLADHYEIDFDQVWQHRIQRSKSVMINAVTRIAVDGEKKRFSQLEKGEMKEILGRNGKTVPDDSVMYNRWINTKKFERVTWIDEWDDKELGGLKAPEGPHMKQHGWAYDRRVDATIRDTIEGTSLTGTDGTGLTAMPSSQKVLKDFVRTGGAVNSGLTFAKVSRAKEIMDLNEVERSGRFFCISAQEEQDLINDVAEIRDRDFTQVQPITDGTLENKFWMGYNWLVYEGLTVDTNVRNCLAWQKDSILFGDGEKRSNVDVLADQSHSIQVRTRARMGGTRLEEKPFVIVETYHA